jgi:Bacterial PH domain
VKQREHGHDRADELLALAARWVSHPRGYIRELKAAASVLEADEHATKVFLLFRGRLAGRGGLAIITDRRMIFVQAFLWRATVTPIPWNSIRDARLVETRLNADLRITTSTGKWNFWQIGSERQSLAALRQLILERSSR